MEGMEEIRCKVEEAIKEGKERDEAYKRLEEESKDVKKEKESLMGQNKILEEEKEQVKKELNCETQRKKELEERYEKELEKERSEASRYLRSRPTAHYIIVVEDGRK